MERGAEAIIMTNFLSRQNRKQSGESSSTNHMVANVFASGEDLKAFLRQLNDES